MGIIHTLHPLFNHSVYTKYSYYHGINPWLLYDVSLKCVFNSTELEFLWTNINTNKSSLAPIINYLQISHPILPPQAESCLNGCVLENILHSMPYHNRQHLWVNLGKCWCVQTKPKKPKTSQCPYLSKSTLDIFFR